MSSMRLGILPVLGIAAIMFAIGFASAYVVYVRHEHPNFAIREYDERYQFIRRLLICQINEGEESREFHSLERRVERQIAAAQQDEKLVSASVYFRELDSGKWMGVNELEGYSPASLLKVPIMMSYFRDALTRPEVLTTLHKYVQTDEKNDLVTKPMLTSSQRYTVLELIRAMIIQSDNSAKDLLEEHANQSTLDETYAALEMKDPYDASGELYELSAKQYGLFFRVLYNGTFLSRERSNEALQLLSESEFNLGLRAGTPSNIIVAHKYGVRGFTRDDGSHGVELSDCGIIYDPASPYLLCVMTSGANAYVLAEVIKDISEEVYQAMISNRE